MRPGFAFALALAAVTSISGGAAAQGVGEPCFYRGSMFVEEGVSCQDGAQFRCTAGGWVALQTPCVNVMVAPSRPCQFAGINFSTGSASCQEGIEYRCEDGAWRSIGGTCQVAQVPIHIDPSGATCRYESITVATNSTVCQAGKTVLCNNGTWIHLGTACR